MAAGLPVLASNVPPMRRVIREAQSGFVSTPGDSRAIATLLIRLFGDEQLRRVLGTNGKKATECRYAWKHDAHRFVQAIER
jgi:glycosyltransferase involved in cell wall biosynthesis